MINIGDIVPLSAQAHDGNEILKVVAIIFDDTNKRLGEIELSHVANGLYQNNTLKMPDVIFLTAQYVTNKLDDYEISSDTFLSLPKIPPKEKIIKGHIVGVQKIKGLALGITKREN